MVWSGLEASQVINRQNLFVWPTNHDLRCKKLRRFWSCASSHWRNFKGKASRFEKVLGQLQTENLRKNRRRKKLAKRITGKEWGMILLFFSLVSRSISVRSADLYSKITELSWNAGYGVRTTMVSCYQDDELISSSLSVFAQLVLLLVLQRLARLTCEEIFLIVFTDFSQTK